LHKHVTFDFFEGLPKVAAYSATLRSLEGLQKAVLPVYDDVLVKKAEDMGAFYITQKQSPLLVSFPLCPFAQRVRTLLEHKRVDYEIKFVDLRNKPEWFLKLSPLGKVPLLQVHP
jgi:hypothetical protein